jgi:hypothetical protein
MNSGIISFFEIIPFSLILDHRFYGSEQVGTPAEQGLKEFVKPLFVPVSPGIINNTSIIQRNLSHSPFKPDPDRLSWIMTVLKIFHFTEYGGFIHIGMPLPGAEMTAVPAFIAVGINVNDLIGVVEEIQISHWKGDIGPVGTDIHTFQFRSCTAAPGMTILAS